MTRQGKKWTIREELSLIREYELLHMYIEDIAKKHNRSPLSIVYKLQAEGLVTDITVEHYKGMKNINSKKFIKDEEDDMSYDNDSSSDYVDEDDDESDHESDDDYDVEDEVKNEEDEYADMPDLVDADDLSEVDKLTDRVWGLETSVNQIGTMVKTLFDHLSFNNKNKKKLTPLRKTL